MVEEADKKADSAGVDYKLNHIDFNVGDSRLCSLITEDLETHESKKWMIQNNVDLKIFIGSWTAQSIADLMKLRTKHCVTIHETDSKVTKVRIYRC